MYKEEERMKWFKHLKEIEEQNMEIKIEAEIIPLKDFCILLRKAGALFYSHRIDGSFVRRLGHLVYNLTNANISPIYITRPQMNRLLHLQTRK